MQAHTHTHTHTHQTQSNRRGSLHTLNRPQPKDWTTVTWRHPKPPPDACNMAKCYSIMTMYDDIMIVCSHVLSSFSSLAVWKNGGVLVSFITEWCTHHRQGKLILIQMWAAVNWFRPVNTWGSSVKDCSKQMQFYNSSQNSQWEGGVL